MPLKHSVAPRSFPSRVWLQRTSRITSIPTSCRCPALALNSATARELTLDRAAMREERRAVALIARDVVSAPPELITAELVRPPALAHERLRVRVEHELVRIEPVPLLRGVRSVTAISVHSAGP